MELRRKYTMSSLYADYCRRHNKKTVGKRVVAPIATELEQLLSDASTNELDAEFYRDQLAHFRKLAARL